MAAPSGGRHSGGGGASLWVALLLAAVALRPAEAVSEPTTVAFDVRPGGVVHSFSQNAGPGDRYSCVFTYASQGGTNERWQMSLGTSEDHQHFTCTIWRPQGKSYLYFTQFRAEVRGAEVEYGMAYSKAAFEKESDVPLQSEEFEVTKTADVIRCPPVCERDQRGTRTRRMPLGFISHVGSFFPELETSFRRARAYFLKAPGPFTRKAP
uniref:Myeloid derived growth factor n=1 Tax=Equus asinus TaxID=9793 RepID=A0A9L0ISC3_EQUAS